MRKRILFSLLAATSVAPVAFAQDAAGAAAPMSPMANLIPFALIFVVMFFLVIRPQMKQAKARQLALDALKKGDVVVTGGGVIGKVSKLVDDTVVLEIASGVEIKVLRGTITGLYVKQEAPAAPAKRDSAVKNDNSAPSKENVANDN